MPDPVLGPERKNPPDGVRKLKGLLADQGFYKGDVTTGAWGVRLTEAVVYFQQTHIGQDGRQLQADGVVGEKTWWALENAHGEPQRNNLEPKIPAGLPEQRVAVLKKALAEHAKGVKEEPNGSNRGPEVDKYFPGWLLAKLKKGQKGEAWCAFFVNWVVTEAMGKRPWGGYIGSCTALLKASKAKGLPVYQGGANLCPGDAFLLPAPGGKMKHIGLVLRVSDDGSKINTVEGNCGNRVKVGVREVADMRFVNFYGDNGHSIGFERGLVAAADVAGAGTR